MLKLKLKIYQALREKFQLTLHELPTMLCNRFHQFFNLKNALQFFFIFDPFAFRSPQKITLASAFF